MITLRSLLVALLLGVAALSPFGHTLAAESLKGSRPNIVLVMPDDVSYGGISAYGGRMRTPQLDLIYSKALRFEDFHVSPTCSPTRAALLTGRHECYAGVTHTIKLRDRLSLQSKTLADMLKEAGYTTGIFGKWHLGDGAEYRPDQRGFDEVYIHGAGGIGQNYPHSADFPNNCYRDPVLYHNGKVIETTGYCTDLFFNRAIDWISEVQDGDKPFFAYVPLNVVHSPNIPPILPGGGDGSMLANLDANVGLIWNFLETAGLSESTLFIYMTDNGANSGRKGLKGGKGSPYEGGTRVPCMMYWKGKIEGPATCDALTAHIDLYPTFAELAGSDDAAPGDKPWDGRSFLSLMEDPQAEWSSRYFVSHKTRWNKAADSQYNAAAIRNERYKIVFPGKNKGPELYDLANDLGEKTDIAGDHPEIVARLKGQFDAWWQDVQPFMVNDHLETVPETYKPYHELYREQMGEEKFKQAMTAMTWTGGKPAKLARKVDRSGAE